MPRVKTKQIFDPIYNEYRVDLYIDGKCQYPATYFTDDKQDAIETANDMRRRAIDNLKEKSNV
jgi:hypothetical protein